MSYLRALFVLLAIASVGIAEEVQILGGKSFKGTIVGIDRQEVRIQTADGKVEKIPLSKVLAVNFQDVKQPPKDTPYQLLRLFDDSELFCQEITFGGKDVNVTLLSGQKATFPLNSVIGILKDAQKEKLREQWVKLNKSVVDRDRLLVLRDEVLNPIEGTIGDVDEKGEKLEFRRDATTILPVKLEKLHGMIFKRTEAPSQIPVCLIYDNAGNIVSAAKLALKDKVYEVETTTGANIAFTADKLAKLDYNRGKLSFLSEMDPVEVVERSGIGLIVRYQRDKNLDGDPIFLNGVEYEQGLSMHAHTEIEYDLRGKYKTFQAVLGFDPRTGTDSKAVVTILGDGLQLMKQSVRREAQTVALNVRDVNKLRIIVSSSNALDLHDHATLAAAKVSQ